MGKKRNFLPKQNTHDSLVGTLSIGIPSFMYCFFLFPRPHSSSGCFQTGYVYKGQPKFDGAKSASCPNGPPKGAEWFNIRVVVSNSTPAVEVKVYLKGTLVTSFNPRYPIRKRGGVLVANGYKNVVYYKNFKFFCGPIIHVSKRCKRVVDLPGYTELDAAHGIWPKDGFCQVAYLRDSNTSSYQLSVDMYNFMGWRGANSGHLGVFLNAEDQDNYDFVYFRFVAIYRRIRGKLSVC